MYLTSYDIGYKEIEEKGKIKLKVNTYLSKNQPRRQFSACFSSLFSRMGGRNSNPKTKYVVYIPFGDKLKTRLARSCGTNFEFNEKDLRNYYQGLRLTLGGIVKVDKTIIKEKGPNGITQISYLRIFIDVDKMLNVQSAYAKHYSFKILLTLIRYPYEYHQANIFQEFLKLKKFSQEHGVKINTLTLMYHAHLSANATTNNHSLVGMTCIKGLIKALMRDIRTNSYKHKVLKDISTNVFIADIPSGRDQVTNFVNRPHILLKGKKKAVILEYMKKKSTVELLERTLKNLYQTII